LIVILQSEWVALGSVPFAAAIYLLEVFVSFVQAFVFTLLSTVFIGMAAHPDH
jgi:F-type H+-transporting ATPase subunit a